MTIISTVRSETKSELTYDVAFDGKQFYCTCPAWKYCRSTAKTCKHCTAVVTAALTLSGYSVGL